MTKKPQKDPEKVAAAYKGIMNKYITSAKRTLIEADYKRWLKNAAIFFAPALILFLGALSNGATVQEAATVFYLWFLNTLIDLVRKWQAENTYVEK